MPAAKKTDQTKEKVIDSNVKSDSDRVVKSDDVACVHYTGKLESGEMFDTSKDRAPLEFVVGSGQLIKGFDTAVVGMKVGEKKEILVLPVDGYGTKDDKRIQKVQRSMLPKEPEPKEGMMLTISTPTGQMFPAVIKSVETDLVEIDFNHPLAGKNLKFEIEVIGIKDKKDADAKEHDHCSCGSCDCK